MYCDFHTHRVHPGRLELVSASEPIAPLCSLEFHPWCGKTEIPPEFAEKLPRFAALGEVGFDRRRGAALADQLALLDRLLRLGADCRKPVVLHVVGSFETLFEAVKPYPLRFMIHGFRRKSPRLLNELVKRGFRVSLHRELVRDPGIMYEVGRLGGRGVGLESDDADCDPAVLWETAASASGVPDLAGRGEETFREFLNLS